MQWDAAQLEFSGDSREGERSGGTIATRELRPGNDGRACEKDEAGASGGPHELEGGALHVSPGRVPLNIKNHRCKPSL